MRLTLFTRRFLSMAFLLSYAFQIQTTARNDTVQQTCTKSAAADANIKVDFCVRSLESVPLSESADLFKLGEISIQLIKRNLTSTSQYIEKLLKNSPVKSFTKPRLEDCRELYSDAGETVSDASSVYESKQYRDANVKLSSVMDSVTSCADGFKEGGGGVSPLTKQNDDAFELTAIALSIVTMQS